MHGGATTDEKGNTMKRLTFRQSANDYRKTIKKALKESGVTQRDAAKIIGIAPEYLNGWLNGRRRLSKKKVDLLADFVGLSIIRPNPIAVSSDLDVSDIGIDIFFRKVEKTKRR